MIWLIFILSTLILVDPILTLTLQITLVPHLENFPIFQGGGVPERMREEFERYNCREQQLSVLKYDMHEICSNYIFSITAIMEEEGLGKGKRDGLVQDH